MVAESVGTRVSRRAGESSRYPLVLSWVEVRLSEGRRGYPAAESESEAGDRLRAAPSLGMVMRAGSGSGSSSTGLKRSAYPWAVTERERVGRVAVGRVSLGSVSRLLPSRPMVALSPNRPLPLDGQQNFTAAVVVAQLGVEEGGQVLDHVDLGLLDVLHAPEDVFAGLLVLCLLRAQLLLHAEVFLLRLLHLGERRVVGEAARLELLARGLPWSARGRLKGCTGPIAVLVCVPGTLSSARGSAPAPRAMTSSRWQHTSLARGPDARWRGPGLLQSVRAGGRLLEIRTGQAIAKLRVGLKVLAMGDHGGAQMAARELLLLVVALCALGERLDVDGHGPLHLVHAWEVSIWLRRGCRTRAYPHGAGSSPPRAP